MEIKYSKAKEGNQNISKNFKVKEFACKDGSDEIIISTDTVSILQHIRNLFDSSITINSAYRTPSYNAKVGGASNSQHKYGKAADCKSLWHNSLVIAKCAQLLGATGIGHYPTFCHIDTRDNKSYWKQNKGSSSIYSVSYHIDKLGIINVQNLLNATAKSENNESYFCGATDGVAGNRTKDAFKFFCDNAPKAAKKEMLKLLK